LLSLAFEKVSIFAHVFRRNVFKRSQLFEFIAPNVFFEHDVLILTDLLDVTSQNIGRLVLEKIVFSSRVSVFCSLVFDFDGFFYDVIALEALSCFIESFKEIHHVSKSDVDLEIVHDLEYISGFNLAVDVE